MNKDELNEVVDLATVFRCLKDIFFIVKGEIENPYSPDDKCYQIAYSFPSEAKFADKLRTMDVLEEAFKHKGCHLNYDNGSSFILRWNKL